MHSSNRTKRLLVAVTASGMFALAAFYFGCWYYQIWSYSDFLEYRETQKYALGSKLWTRQIAVGHDIEEVIAEFPPHRSFRFGRWISINYFPNGPALPGYLHFESLVITAKDGKIVAAQLGSCTCSRTFIKSSVEEDKECTRAFQLDCEERAAKGKVANP